LIGGEWLLWCCRQGAFVVRVLCGKEKEQGQTLIYYKKNSTAEGFLVVVVLCTTSFPSTL